MVKSISLLPLGIVAATAFTSQPISTRHESTTSLFGGAQGYSTSKQGKKERVEKLKGLLDSSEMIFTVPAGSMTVAESEQLRRSMPEGTTVTVIKNTLMNRAVEGTDFESASTMLKGPNMWFFVEDDISATIKAYNAFLKEAGKKDTHAILGGVLESTAYDAKGVEAIGQLPSKDELYAKIAGAINAVPTKVARVIKEPSSKLARAIKLATTEDED